MEPVPRSAVEDLKSKKRDEGPFMLELGLFVGIAAIAATFLTDATSGTMKVARAMRRRNNIRVADEY